MISIIVAMTQDRVIGLKNDLPWHLSADLKRFKQTTTGNTTIMGRKTFESIASRIGGPLPNRLNIVLSRRKLPLPEGCLWAGSPEEAVAISPPGQEIFVIGGAQVYKAFLPFADRLLITLVNASVAGDAYFPHIHKAEWVLSEQSQWEEDPVSHLSYSFQEFRRVAAKKQLVDPTSARSDEYRDQLGEIAAAGVCPFCPDSFKWHPNEVLQRNASWLITPIRQNYPNADLHFLLIGEDHVEHFLELSSESWGDLRDLVRWACNEYGLKDKGGGFALRFGPTAFTGATVAHLHAHLIVPQIDEDTQRARVVNFPIG